MTATYKFTLNRTTSLLFNLSVATGNADLDILAADGTTVLYSSTNPLLLPETFTRQLAAGNYFARVRLVTGSTGYNLNITQIG